MPIKSLGQHWLHDRLILEAIVDCAVIGPTDTVLEIGPGLGTMTSVLLARAGRVVAVEFDADLARKLPGQFPGKNLTVVNQDILSYDFSGLPDDFIVVGNIPYYITNKIVRKVSEGPHRPKTAVLLVQKEVAERLAAAPGAMSLLSLSAQVFHEVSLGPVVLRDAFTPPRPATSASRPRKSVFPCRQSRLLGPPQKTPQLASRRPRSRQTRRRKPPLCRKYLPRRPRTGTQYSTMAAAGHRPQAIASSWAKTTLSMAMRESAKKSHKLSNVASWPLLPQSNQK